MNKVLRVHPTLESSSTVYWKEKNIAHKFDSGFEFADAFVFLDRNEVVVFHFAESHRDKFVGKVFDYSGKPLFEVPFPSLGTGQSHVECLYNWASEIDNGVKIVFGTDSVSYRDFWCDFDLIKKKYTATNEAR